jgi:hypothetical protein
MKDFGLHMTMITVLRLFPGFQKLLPFPGGCTCDDYGREIDGFGEAIR